MNNIVIYDIETLINLFTVTFYDVNNDKYIQIAIHDNLIDQSDEFFTYMTYLSLNDYQMVGFNNYKFDYPILHYILEEGRIIPKLIHDYAQKIIDDVFSSIPSWQSYLKQIDLFRINHYNNRARTQSLKGLQINMKLEDVRDMPFSHNYMIKTKEEIDEVLAYNKWDVYSTYVFYLKNLERILLRIELNKLYNIDVTNYSDVGIGETLFLKFLSEDMNIDKKILRQERTHRDNIVFKDIILTYIKYDDARLNNLLKEFKSIVISNTKHGFKKSLLLDNEVYEFAQGGLHQCTKPGIYKSSEDIVILDIDVSLRWRN